MTATGGCLRVVLYDLRDVAFDHFETPLRYMRSSIGYFSRVLEKQSGFSSAHWGVDLDDEKIAAVTRWSDLGAIQAACPELDRLAADAEAHGIHRLHALNIELFPLPRDGGGAGPGPAIDSEAWLRVVTYAVGADDGHAREYMVGHIQGFRQVLEEQRGFLRGYWGRDLAAGAMAAVTYWDSLRAIVAAKPVLQRLQVEAVAEGVRPMDVHNIHLFAVTPERDGADGFVDAVQRRRVGPQAV